MAESWRDSVMYSQILKNLGIFQFISERSQSSDIENDLGIGVYDLKSVIAIIMVGGCCMWKIRDLRYTSRDYYQKT